MQKNIFPTSFVSVFTKLVGLILKKCYHKCKERIKKVIRENCLNTLIDAKDTEFIKDIIRNNIERVFKELNISYPVRTSPILVTGGGGRSFFKSIKRRYPSARIIEDNLFSKFII